MLYGESVLSDLKPVFSTEQEEIQQGQQQEKLQEQIVYQTYMFSSSEKSIVNGDKDETNTFLIRFLQGRITPETIIVDRGTDVTFIVHNLRDNATLFVLEPEDVELYLAPNQVEEITFSAERNGVFFFDERSTPFIGYLIVE